MRIPQWLLLLLSAFLLATGSSAQTVTWGNDLASNNLQNGADGFLDESFKFELGTFADTSGGQPGTPFDPASGEYVTLDTLWKPIDFAISPADSGWNPVTRTFAGLANIIESALTPNVGTTDGISASTDLFADPDLVPGGEQIYLWIHNGTLFSGSDATETGLFTGDSWKTKNFNVLSFPLELNLTDLNTVIYGQKLPTGLQTVALKTVPEPTVGLSLLLGSFVLFGVRRRKLAVSR